MQWLMYATPRLLGTVKCSSFAARQVSGKLCHQEWICYEYARAEGSRTPFLVLSVTWAAEAKPCRFYQFSPSNCLHSKESVLVTCRQGEEVTIFYGGHPDAVFYLFFGFLPKSNPSNLVVMSLANSNIAEVLEKSGMQQKSDKERPNHLMRYALLVDRRIYQSQPHTLNGTRLAVIMNAKTGTVFARK